MSNTQNTWDATVDFNESGALEAELTRALDGAEGPLTVIVRADGDTCEIGELYTGDAELPAVCEADWVVTGSDVDAVATALRELV